MSGQVSLPPSPLSSPRLSIDTLSEAGSEQSEFFSILSGDESYSPRSSEPPTPRSPGHVGLGATIGLQPSDLTAGKTNAVATNILGQAANQLTIKGTPTSLGEVSFQETYTSRNSDGSVHTFIMTITQKDICEILGEKEGQREIDDLLQARLTLIDDRETATGKKIKSFDVRDSMIVFEDGTREAIGEKNDVIQKYRSLYEKVKRADPKNKGAPPHSWPSYHEHSTGNESGRPTLPLATERAKIISQWTLDEFCSNPIIQAKLDRMPIDQQKSALEQMLLADQLLKAAKRRIEARLDIERNHLKTLPTGSTEALTAASQIRHLEMVKEKVDPDTFNRFALYYSIVTADPVGTNLAQAVPNAEDRIAELTQIFEGELPPNPADTGKFTKLMQKAGFGLPDRDATVEERSLFHGLSILNANDRLERTNLSRALGISLGRDPIEAGILRMIRQSVSTPAGTPLNTDVLLRHPEIYDNSLKGASQAAQDDFNAFVRDFFAEARTFQTNLRADAQFTALAGADFNAVRTGFATAIAPRLQAAHQAAGHTLLF